MRKEWDDIASKQRSFPHTSTATHTPTYVCMYTNVATYIVVHIEVCKCITKIICGGMQSKIEFGNLYFWKEIPNPTRDSDKIAPLATQHKLSSCILYTPQ